jgi:hypothetical protein
MRTHGMHPSRYEPVRVVWMTCLKCHRMLGQCLVGFRDIHVIAKIFGECEVVSEVRTDVQRCSHAFRVYSELQALQWDSP